MPLYYFHTRNGHLALDERGALFPDDQAARDEALTAIAEMMRFRTRDFWETRRFSIAVTGGDGRPIVTLTTSAEDGLPEDWPTS